MFFLNQLFFKNNGWITCSGRTSRRQRSLGSPAVCNSWWTDSPQPETQEINLSFFAKTLFLTSNLEHVSGFYFPLPPQLCLLQASNAVIWATLKVPGGEIFLNILFKFQLRLYDKTFNTCLRSPPPHPWMAWTHGTQPWWTSLGMR